MIAIPSSFRHYINPFLQNFTKVAYSMVPCIQFPNYPLLANFMLLHVLMYIWDAFIKASVVFPSKLKTTF